MNIAIGSDHAGFERKQFILEYLTAKGHIVTDVGTQCVSRTHSAIYALKVTDLVNLGTVERGILICGTGVGMAICANKVNGIRAVMGSDSYTVEQARRHNDTNILTLGSLTLDKESTINLIDIWLATEFEASQTRLHRLTLINDIENRQT
ncbi:ribose 5-phosphate isomerase B [Vibrio maerlii]|uniref:ribose 5-phosphate isomerase B n=1 Tax=Vibrio maerlii TaxID=2231648 RepID=UPI000E3D81B0|nr:ribose 5-phosphate isomerase B [Vibrio maerlii]